jgi:phosphonate transport system substrate-binding protein
MLAACWVAPTIADPIRFAPLPLEDPKIVREQFQGFADFLTEVTGRRAQMVNVVDYSEILARFRRGEIDLAYLGPLPYVILSRDFAAAEPLGCFRDAGGQASYTCSLVAYGGAVPDVADLRGLKVGLTQPYSTCGYLAVSQMFEQAGASLEDEANAYAYAGSHSAAALGVVRGDYDLAGVKSAIAARYAHLDLAVVAESGHFPGFALVANTDRLDRATVDRLRAALLSLDPAGNAEDRARVSNWGQQLRLGAVPPEACDYGGVASALERVPWPLPGAGP